MLHKCSSHHNPPISNKIGVRQRGITKFRTYFTAFYGDVYLKNTNSTND